MSKNAKARAPRVTLGSLLTANASNRPYIDGLVRAGLVFFRARGEFIASAKAELAALVKVAKTAERDKAQKAVETSLAISYVSYRLVDANPKMSDDEAIAAAHDASMLKQRRAGLSPDKMGDDFRSPAMDGLFATSRKVLERYRVEIGLETVTKGGARKGAGRKGTKDGEQSKLVTGAANPVVTGDAATSSAPVVSPDNAPRADKPRDISATEDTLAGNAPKTSTAGAPSVAPSTLTTGTLANYFGRVHEDMARTVHLVSKDNPDCSEKLVNLFKTDKDIAECLARLDQEFARLVTLLDRK